MTRRSKRIISILLSVLCILTLLSGCGKEEKIEEKKTVYKKTSVSLSNGVVPAKAAFAENVVYYVSGDETSEKISTYDIEKKEEKELSIAIPEEEKVLALHCLDSGELIVLTGKGEGTFYLAAYDKENKELWKNEITENLYDKDTQTSVALEVDKEGNIYLFNGFYGTAIWNSKGEFQFKLRSDELMEGINRIGDKVYTYLKDNEQYVLREIDVKKQDWKDKKYENFPVAYSVNAKAVMEQAEGRLFVNTQAGVAAYDMKKETGSKLLDWTGHGLMAEEIFASSVQEENLYFIAALENDVKLVTLSPAAEGEVPVEKEVITINPEVTHGYIDDAIRKFNEQSDKYVVEYAEKLQGNGPQQDLKRDVELMAGKGTDIICLWNMQSYYKYADKGILEDLYPYLDNDEETGREDYLPNVCKAYERDGKLYCMVPGFEIATLTVPTKYVGDKKSLTIEELKEISNNLPEGIRFSQVCTDKYMLFAMLLRYTIPTFIDYQNYTCSFESEEFVEWIKFLNSLELEDKEAAMKKSQKDYLISMTFKNWVTDYQSDTIGFEDDELTYIGYPCKNGSGSFISGKQQIGIWSQSEHKEGAWEFIKFVMSEEMQGTLKERESCSLPVRISTLEKECEKAMETEYETDKNGNKVEKIKGMAPAPVWGGEPIPFYAATEKDIAKMRGLIDSVEENTVLDMEIENIVLEEVAAFYEGDKTAEEVAGFIQNRVQLYLNEIK